MAVRYARVAGGIDAVIATPHDGGPSRSVVDSNAEVLVVDGAVVDGAVVDGTDLDGCAAFVVCAAFVEPPPEHAARRTAEIASFVNEMRILRSRTSTGGRPAAPEQCLRHPSTGTQAVDAPCSAAAGEHLAVCR